MERNPLHTAILADWETLKQKLDMLKLELIGKKAKVLTFYNGQPHGRSAKNLKGELITIKHVSFSDAGRVIILPEGYHLFIDLDKLEVQE